MNSMIVATIVGMVFMGLAVIGVSVWAIMVTIKNHQPRSYTPEQLDKAERLAVRMIDANRRKSEAQNEFQYVRAYNDGWVIADSACRNKVDKLMIEYVRGIYAGTHKPKYVVGSN